MNKRGQLLGAAIVTAIMLFIVGSMVIDFFKDDITIIRNSDNLDCANSAVISDGTKLTCLGIGLIVPYFFLAIISLTGGVIVANFIKWWKNSIEKKRICILSHSQRFF